MPVIQVSLQENHVKKKKNKKHNAKSLLRIEIISIMPIYISVT